MPASFALELDTTAPTATVGEGTIDGSIVRIPYEVDEPGIISAVAVNGNGQEFIGTITASELQFPYVVGLLDINLELRDSVFNYRALNLNSLVVGTTPLYKLPTMVSFERTDTKLEAETLGTKADLPSSPVGAAIEGKMHGVTLETTKTGADLDAEGTGVNFG